MVEASEKGNNREPLRGGGAGCFTGCFTPRGAWHNVFHGTFHRVFHGLAHAGADASFRPRDVAGYDMKREMKAPGAAKPSGRNSLR